MPSTMRNAPGRAHTVILSWRAITMPGLNLAGVLPAAAKSDAILILFLHQSQLHEKVHHRATTLQCLPPSGLLHASLL